jgi:hypothetical protein
MAEYTLNQRDMLITGSEEPDTAIITKVNNWFFGAGGNDTITIKSGKSNHASGDHGNDTIYIKGGSYNSAVGDDGVNTMKISGGDHNFLEGGDNKDYLTITGKGSYHEVYGGGGADLITVDTTSTDNQVYGEAGNDTIDVIKSGKNLHIYGGAGKDTITVRGTATWEIYGYQGSGKDKDGANIIEVYSGKGRILGGVGNDTITLGKGVKSGISVFGGEGNDKITVSYGSKHMIKGYDGQDTIIINKGKGHTLDADSNDIITLKKNTSAAVINIQTGISTKAGKVTLNKGSKAKLILDNYNHKYSSKLTITAAKGTVTDKTLYFTGQYQTAYTINYTFKQDGSNLVINNKLVIANFTSGNYSGGFTFGYDSSYPSHMSFDEVKAAANWK